MANVRWSDGSIGSIGERILRSDIFLRMAKLRNFTKGESIVLKGEALPALGMVRWSDGWIGSIGQAILRSDIYFTDGEMT